MRQATAIVVLASSVVCSIGAASPPPSNDRLSEGGAALWGADAFDASASVSDDTALVHEGSSSLRFETTGGFDTWMWAPETMDGAWDVLGSGAQGLSFWVWADNPNLGFQNGSPWIRLCTTVSDYVEYNPAYDLLNTARGTWLEVRIPLNGDGLWTPNVVGNPDLSEVNFIEIHSDTWDAGFTLWIDDVSFDVMLSPPGHLSATPGNARVDLAWDEFRPPPVGGMAAFDHYAVYRDTSAFDDVTGMTPIATLDDATMTTYTDTAASNGTGYYYAVTAVLAGGQETSDVASVGPRVPRDESDLQILCVSRTPRYPRYAPTYTGYSVTDPNGYGPYNFSVATGLGQGQDAGTQRWPDVGDTVTYTAWVRNRGSNLWVGTLGGVWTVDGQVVDQPSQFVALNPGDRIDFELARTWDGGDHEIEFSMNPANDDRPGNNSISITSRSVAFLSYVDASFLEEFRAESATYPDAITDDFIDWLHAHMARFNAMFADAGTPKRVHFGVLNVLEDAASDPDHDTIYWAIFPFRYRAGQGSLRMSGYYSLLDDLDFGLLHEMGHQLGLVDLYRLDMSPQGNHVSGSGYSATSGLMHGCSPYMSEHSAYAMTHWLDVAHGYFGQYMYQMPERVTLRILGSNGNPLPGATVRVYQKNDRPGLGEVITTQVKSEGTTGSNGEWTLPNVQLDPGLVPPTFGGDAMFDNPFGYIDVVGRNGLLLLEVEKDGFVDYAWLEITEVNNAFFAGYTDEAVFERRVGLGGYIERFPPADLAEGNAGEWSSWAQDGSISLHDDDVRVAAGDASVRIEATGGSDNYARYPGTHQAIWDLSGVDRMHFWVYAENPNGSFQNASPWIRLGSNGGYFQWRPSWDLLNSAMGQWVEMTVPIDGDSTWTRSQVGQPDMSEVNYWQFHADTWGGGFTVWLDGVRFDPPPCIADFNGDGVVNSQDFIRYLNLFSASDPAADLNADGVVTSQDFVAFLNHFVDGC
jgi:hypothetical protein